MYRRIFFALVLLIGTLTSCNKDHDHEIPYNVPYYNGQYYYYYNGVYYQDANYTVPYKLDANHFYSGRIEWKGFPDRTRHHSKGEPLFWVDMQTQ